MTAAQRATVVALLDHIVETRAELLGAYDATDELFRVRRIFEDAG